jgi:hypothetical protein
MGPIRALPAMPTGVAWDDRWSAIRAASRVNRTRRNAAMIRAKGWLSVSDIADAARLSVSQTRRILESDAQ